MILARRFNSRRSDIDSSCKRNHITLPAQRNGNEKAFKMPDFRHFRAGKPVVPMVARQSEQEDRMRIRRLALAALAALTVTAAAAPAFAHDDWGWRERHEWREHAWREHERREQAWREHEWREHNYRPYAAVPGYVAPPTIYYGAPGYYH
ncbi:MAG TPA: hypothetical protein VE690_08695 [Rhodopila sp.]|nr:hypothetical protein [Rhodopila sp.]